MQSLADRKSPVGLAFQTKKVPNSHCLPSREYGTDFFSIMPRSSYYEIGEYSRSWLNKRREARNGRDDYPAHLCGTVVSLVNPSDDELWLLGRHGDATSQAWKAHCPGGISMYAQYPRLYVERKSCIRFVSNQALSFVQTLTFGKPEKPLPLMNFPRGEKMPKLGLLSTVSSAD